jgi:nitroreductase
MTLQKTALTAAPIAPVLADRWSPRAFDQNHQISQHELLSILEAGRWAPSAFNGQPWRFSVGVRGDAVHTKIVESMSGFNQAWAPHASALIVISAKTVTPDGQPYQVARFDVGLATMSMIIQTQEIGLHSHPMTGLDRAALGASLELAEDLEVTCVIAVGQVTSPDSLPEAAREREIAPRVRLTLEEIVLHGRP